jgi:pimeloyl-ACP methyl ester carboxylesterase
VPTIGRASDGATEVCGIVLLDPASPQDWRSPSDERRAQLARANTLCRHGRRAARLRVTDLIVALIRLGAIDLARGFGRLVSFGDYRPADESVLVPAAKLPPDVLDIAIRSWTRSRFFEALGSQISSISASAAEVADDQDFGTLPLVIGSSEVGLDARQRSHHELLATRSRRGRHVLAAGSGHWIPLDRPDVVVAAVRDVLALAGTSASSL